MGAAGCNAFRSCTGDFRAQVVAYFDAEPAAKAVVIAKSRLLDGKPPRAPGPLEDNETRVARIIKAEEQTYFDLCEKAPRIVTKFIKKHGLTGESLCKLHHTHGYDPTSVEAVLGRCLPSALHDQYQEAYAEHRKTGHGPT